MSEKRGSRRQSKSKELTEKLSKDELLRRLKSIGEELSNVDQDDNAVNYDDLAASLASDFLLKHKEKDIKACVACCCADILRIYAPEPPYNEDQLKGIFSLIVNQFKNLENPESVLFKRAYYLLESLGMVKSFNICCEIDAQDLVVKLFRNLFNVVNEKHNIKVKNFILDVLAAIIQESEFLSQDVLDAVLINLVEPRKSSKPSSYKLAGSLIERCSTALEPYLQVFFNDFLVLHKETESDLERHTYDLILELNKISKTILLSVLPQLEFKLKSVEEQERLEVVRVLGLMFSEEDSELASMNKPLWKSFLDRFIDISAEVRVECVQIGKQLIVSKPDLVPDVADRLRERFHDTEEKVRLQAVVSVCEAAAERIDAVPKELIEAAKERMRDKKWPVRRAALTCIAKLYKGLTIGRTLDSSSAEKINWAPDKILHSYYQNSIEDRLCVERIVHGCLVPVSLETDEKMKVLLRLYASLEDYALKAFDGLLKYRSSINNEFKQLLEIHKDESDEREKLIFKKILTLARSLPEPFKAQENLKKFATMLSDKTLYQLLRSSTEINSGCEKIKKSVADIVKKISSKNPIIETVKALLDRSCHMLVDSQSLSILMRYVKKSIEGMDDDEDEEEAEEDSQLSHKAKRGLLLLKCLASVLPEIFKEKECYEELLQLIKHQDNFVVETGLRILFHVGDGLETFDRTLCSCFQPVLSKLATSGTREQGIFAVRCLSKMLKDSTVVMDRLINALSESLDYDSAKLITTLASLGEIASCAPSIFEVKQTQIVREFVVKDLLVVDRETTPLSQASVEEWGEDDELTREAKLKIEGMKLMVKWLLGLQANHRNSSTPVFRLLDTILKNDGDLNGNDAVGPKDKTRLRLAAAKGIINLVQDRNYADVITVEQYQQLALTVQDSCYEVRQKFSVKLHKALDVLKLPLDYLAFFMLSATDPSKDRKSQARQMITKSVQTRRDYIKQHSSAAARPYAILPEYALPYGIYLIAHHPDFDPKKSASINEAKEYLWFFLEPLLGAKADNASFLKKLTDNIKQLRDAQDPENEAANEKLYLVCDLVIWLLTNKTHTVILKEFPGNPVLPKKLFQPANKKIKPNTKNYLPVGFQASPKAKKPVPLDIRMTSAKEKSSTKSKETPTKRTTRVRTKGKDFRATIGKLTENDADADLSPVDVGHSDASEDDDGANSDDYGDKIPESINQSRKSPPLGVDSPKTKIADKLPKKQTTLDKILRKDDKEKDKNNQKSKIGSIEGEDIEIGLDASDLSDAAEEVGPSTKTTEKVLPVNEIDDVKTKARNNVRMTSSKRDFQSTKDSVVEKAIPRKRAKANEPEIPDDIASVEENKTAEEKMETKVTEQEKTVVEEESSVILNVRRKNTRRR